MFPFWNKEIQGSPSLTTLSEIKILVSRIPRWRSISPMTSFGEVFDILQKRSFKSGLELLVIS